MQFMALSACQGHCGEGQFHSVLVIREKKVSSINWDQIREVEPSTPHNFSGGVLRMSLSISLLIGKGR